MSNKNSDRSAFIAAALIMLFVFLGVYFLPPLMKQMAEYNEWLAYGMGFAFIISFVGIFWVRSLFEKRQKKSED